MRTIKTSVVIALLFGLMASCGGPQVESTLTKDSRPLSERINAMNSGPFSLQPPWSLNAVEASPATNWVLDGEPVENISTFVVGQVQNVAAGFSLGEPEGSPNIVGQAETMKQNFLPFNSEKALSDVVIIEIIVSQGVGPARSQPPDKVKIALALPSPTDLDSLRTEIQKHKSLAAIIFPAVALNAEEGLFELQDSFFLGTVVEDAQNDSVVFGDLTGPNPFYKREVTAIKDILAGAGTILISSNRMTDDGRLVRD